MHRRWLSVIPAFFVLALLLAGCSSSEAVPDAGMMPTPDATMQGCASGFTDCNGTCIPTKRDPQNCGGCGKACKDGEVCVQGGCALQCGGGATKCNSRCVDTKSDPTNCGSCGTKCQPGEVCSAGKCTLTCQAGLTNCSQACVDVQTDDENCGKCGGACDPGQHCVGGTCTANCAPPWSSCPAPDGGTTCVDLKSDPNNCGMCGNKCPNGNFCSTPDGGTPTCGIGCFGGTTLCNGKCADTQIDPQHCGGCNKPCNGTCYAGVCCPGNLIWCNNQCSNPSTCCGNDCWGPNGCTTLGGHCIQFSCRGGNVGGSFCNGCKGWQEVSYTDWMNGGWCGDVIQKFRATEGTATFCGSSNLNCCSAKNNCGGGDNAWHFFDGTNNRYTGPCIGCANDSNCSYWNGTDNSNYTRITVCKKY